MFGLQTGARMSERLFELILAVKRKCQSNEERIQGELGLSPAQFHGLVVLDEGQALAGGAFAARMALSVSRGSRVLAALAADGYVRIRESPADRRAVSISLTSKGRRTRQRIFRRMQACESRLCRALDAQRIGELRRALRRLAAAL
jgi:DNA-binding MarR family transcriptional regulator